MLEGICRELDDVEKGAGCLLLAALANIVWCISKHLERMKQTSLANSALYFPL